MLDFADNIVGERTCESCGTHFAIMSEEYMKTPLIFRPGREAQLSFLKAHIEALVDEDKRNVLEWLSEHVKEGKA